MTTRHMGGQTTNPCGHGLLEMVEVDDLRPVLAQDTSWIKPLFRRCSNAPAAPTQPKTLTNAAIRGLRGLCDA